MYMAVLPLQPFSNFEGLIYFNFKQERVMPVNGEDDSRAHLKQHLSHIYGTVQVKIAEQDRAALERA